MTGVFRTLIVPADTVEPIRNLAATWPGGVGMWETPLYTGDTITHYISTGKISAAIAGWMPWHEYEGEILVQSHDGDIPGLVDAINTDNPQANVTEAQINALLTGADISNQPWRLAIARLGLSETPEAD